MTVNWLDLFNQIIKALGFFGLRLLGAVVLIGVGKKVARFMARALQRQMERRNNDIAVVRFLSNIAYWAVFICFSIAAVGMVGIQTSSVVAALGAAGVAVGLALQGSLSNFAAGVLIIMFKPFRIGDFIEMNTGSGVVQDISILTTTLTTPDNKRVIIPNSKVMDGSITNYSTNETRRLMLSFNVAYSSDLDTVFRVLNEIAAAEPRFLKDPEPLIAMQGFDNYAITIAFRPWIKTSDYWQVLFDTNKAVKERFDKEGIVFPFPQRDVHIIHQAQPS